jgi:DNA-binding XRE family transcriptional regulator
MDERKIIETSSGMTKRKLKIRRTDYGLTLQAVADRFERPVTRQAVLAIEKAAIVKARTAAKYEEAVNLALRWKEEMRSVRRRVAPIARLEIAKAARRLRS